MPDVVFKVLEITAPVLVLAMLGALWVRGLRWDFPLEFVTRLAMTLSLPCLILVALAGAQVDPALLMRLSLAALLAYLAIAGLLWALCRLLRLEVRTYLGPLVFGNTGNLGLPLALFAFGPEGLEYAAVVFAVMAVLNFTVGVWIVAGGGGPGRLVREPIAAAVLIGALCLVMGWHLPPVLDNTLRLLGQMAIPLMLLTLGVALARLRGARLGRAAGLSLLKALVCGAVGLAVGHALALPPVPLAVLVVQLITPVAVTSYLLAAKYEADSQAVAGLVVASTLLSLIVLPLTLGVFAV